MSADIELAHGQQRVTCTIGPVSLPGVLLVDGDAWLTRAQLAQLFEVDATTVDHHVGRVKSLNKPQISTGSFPVQIPGKAGSTRSVNTEHYNTKFVCHVGYGIKGERAEEFRDWVTEVLHRDAVPESTQRALEAVIAKQLATVVRAELAPVIADVQKARTDIADISTKLATLQQSSHGSIEKLSTQTQAVAAQLAALDAKSSIQQNALCALQADVSKVSAGHITSKEHKRIQAAIKEFVAFEKALHPGASEASLRKRFYRELEEVTRWSKAWALLPTVLMPTAQQVIDNIRRRQQATHRDMTASRQGDLFNKGAA